jgi:hypothetical protein
MTKKEKKMSDKFPFYIHKIREISPYLLDENEISVLSPFGDTGFAGYIKDAAISCFNAFNKADHKNQQLFFSRLIKEMSAYAQIEWDWPEEEVEWRMAQILREKQKVPGEVLDG